ncbi:MAG: hypothetical protein QJR13_03755 [Bacillota bacterium]|nr:hypothetical protein [Bacillota bacterium]
MQRMARKAAVLMAAAVLVAALSGATLAVGPHAGVPQEELQGTATAIFFKGGVTEGLHPGLGIDIQYGLAQKMALTCNLIYPLGSVELPNLGHYGIQWQVNKYAAFYGGLKSRAISGSTVELGPEVGAVLNLQVGYAVVLGAIRTARLDSGTKNEFLLGVEFPFGYRTDLLFAYQEIEEHPAYTVGLNYAF